MYRTREPNLADENTSNHEHFWYFPNDAIEGVRKNQALAEAVRLAWQAALDRKFPGRRFTLVVLNEYNIYSSLDDPFSVSGEEILPTLRLWSRDLPGGEELDVTYRVAECGPDSVFWSDHLERLFTMEEIFSLIACGPSHPMKLAALRSQHSSAVNS